MILRKRLVFEHINRGPRDNAFLHRRREICLADDAAACTVHEAYAFLHPTHLLHRDHAACLLCQRHMHGDEIRRCKDIIERADGHAERLGPLFINIGIVSDHVHLKGKRTLRHTAPDASHADDAEGLAAELHADISLAVPAARVHRRVSRGDVARQREHHCHRMLRRCDRIASGGVDDDDAALRRRLYIDVVNANAGAPDDLQTICAFKHIRRHLRRRAHHESIVAADNLYEFLM